MGRHIDTIVVGGGATGSAAAWLLARSGVEVALFERLDAPGSADPSGAIELRGGQSGGLLSAVSDGPGRPRGLAGDGSGRPLGAAGDGRGRLQGTAGGGEGRRPGAAGSGDGRLGGSTGSGRAPGGAGAHAGVGGARSVVADRAEPERLRLVADSLRLWRELEDGAGARLLSDGGGVLHGHTPDFDELLRVLPHLGFDAAELTTAEAAERWPGVRFEGRVLHSPDFARIDSDIALTALQQAALREGAELVHRSRVTRVRVLGDDRALVEVAATDADGNAVSEPVEFECRRLVVAAGAWTGRLLGAVLVLPRLSVTENVSLHLPSRQPHRPAGGAAAGRSTGGHRAPGRPESPAVIRQHSAPGDLRHGDWHGAVEVISEGRVPGHAHGHCHCDGDRHSDHHGHGDHRGRGHGDHRGNSHGHGDSNGHHDSHDHHDGHGDGHFHGSGGALISFTEGIGGQVDPDASTARGERRRHAPLLRYARESLPELSTAAEDIRELRRLHAVARDGQLIIDRVGPVSVAAGLSGNGLAIAPAVGALLADLVAGIRAPAPFSVRPERRAATLARR